ncbi:MAG: arylsulfotransferase family protein [Mycobacteriales bacterium]
MTWAVLGGVLVAGASTAAVVVATRDGGADTPGVQRFLSRPDLTPPAIDVLSSNGGTAPGLFFLAPKQKVSQSGPLIVDGNGSLVWSLPEAAGATDFRVQEYQGRPVLTWWQGSSKVGVGQGGYVIMDTAYHQTVTVHAAAGTQGDLHEFQITPAGTALITSYPVRQANLTPAGGPADGYVYDCVAQEIDIATGAVRWQWSALDHVPLTESAVTPTTAGDGSRQHPYDYFHMNSVKPDSDGHVLISSRHTGTVYRVDMTTGAIEWRLGGKASDFTIGDAAHFAWQHDAERQPDGTITLFDNDAGGPDGSDDATHSRALVLDVDTATHRASLVRAYTSPERVLAPSQGNMQVLPNGNVLVGWGAQPYFTEFSPDGTVLYDATFGTGADSYRVYRLEWTGTPDTLPDLAVRAAPHGKMAVSASWNGATEVASWQVLTGDDPAHLSVVRTARRTGFETTVTVPSRRYAQVRALDAHGDVLATSATHDR